MMAVMVWVELVRLGGHRALVSEATAGELERLGQARILGADHGDRDPEVEVPVMRLHSRSTARKLGSFER
jgi:hypothetical protein